MNVSSGSHRGGRIRFDDLHLRRRYSGLAAYEQSKLANVLFTYELARRFRGLCAHAVDPGLVDTGIGFKGANLLARLVWSIRRRAGSAPDAGASTIVHVAAGAAAGASTGLYWRALEPVASSERSYDPDAAQKLWEVSEALTGVAYESRPAKKEAEVA